MSSILKALQKLEKEKAVQQDAAGINVSREILKQQRTDKKMILWLWIGGTVAFAVIVTLSALLFSKPPLQSTVKSAPASAPPAMDNSLPPAAATITAPPVNSKSKTVAAPPAAAKIRIQQLLRPTVPPPQPAAIKNGSTELTEVSAPAREVPRVDVGRKQPQPGTAEQADTSLTLSGIAWNKDSADRLAIINGQATATGATVNGVLIEEILPDRVKVKSAGRTIEIFLGKPAKTN